MNCPLLYEINTRCYLGELSRREGRQLTLGDVPESEFKEWVRLGFTHIWLMGVWTSGPRSRQQGLTEKSLQAAYSEALPDWSEKDVVGSPYAIADYKLSEALGGGDGLKAFRERLRRYGLKLILDFVPNHLGLDHRWVSEKPELFVQSPREVPGTFLQETPSGPRWLAHGKDPYFPSWSDTVQLDYRLEVTRKAMTDLLRSIAARCDGVRCDMAMLLLGDIFGRTWANFPPTGAVAAAGSGEFWSAAISSVKKEFPEFLFMAEAYWGTEPRLQALGFDYTYDKELYDGIVGRNSAAVQGHLFSLPAEALRRGAHFLENHDEPRIASRLSAEEQRAAALIILGLPGLRFLHEGQLTGARVRTPVQLGRRLSEPEQPEMRKFYEQMLVALQKTSVGQGKAEVLRPGAAWAGNPTAQNFVIVQWQSKPGEFYLVVVNLAPHRSQCNVHLTAEGLATRDWTMTDLLGTERYTRVGKEMQNSGLFLDLPAHGAQLFRFS
jgi:hypothetical protein